MNNLELYEKVRNVPKDAQKTIKGGRINGMTDINPMWRIKTLTEQFGPCGIGWYYTVTKKWLEAVGNEIAVFVDIEMYIKIDGEWSKPIHGTGGSMLASKEKSGIYVSDECYKMATTDAISVACKQLGIGADVYWSADSTKYDLQSVDFVTEVHINTLFLELARTGIGRISMLTKYGLKDIHDMNMTQYREAMDILKVKPDKPTSADPVTVPPDDPEAGLPWNDTRR